MVKVLRRIPRRFGGQTTPRRRPQPVLATFATYLLILEVPYE
jgi:hypothetical protein